MARKAKAEEQSVERPLLIDERDGACELCAKHTDGKCDECGTEIQRKEDWAQGRGFQSVKPTHIHIVNLTPENGPAVTGREGKFAELCYKCHRADRLKVYGKGHGESA